MTFWKMIFPIARQHNDDDDDDEEEMNEYRIGKKWRIKQRLIACASIKSKNWMNRCDALHWRQNEINYEVLCEEENTIINM